MSHARRWVAATTNAGKLRELRSLLAPLAIELVSQAQLGITPAPETAGTFVENALAKARCAAACGLPAIADDSGLMVAALDGAPGVHSARFAGETADDVANLAKLLECLAGVPAAQRGAEFYCAVVALARPDDPAPLIATGRWSGTIAERRQGENGFGYDPLFVDAVTGRTAAELTADEKNTRSHRAQALTALVRQLGAQRRETVMHRAGEG